jgi:glucose-1-phosphate adenylyltransferase
VEKGAVVTDSILFFNNTVEQGAQVTRMVSDVNTVFGAGCEVGGPPLPGDTGGITVVGWNNQVPAGTKIGRGCTVFPQLVPEKWTMMELPDGEVLR